MSDNLILKVVVQEGKGFGINLQALVCAVTFGGETKQTTYSVAKDHHVWNITLQWSCTKQQLRRLSSLGQTTCKLVCMKKDESKVGWLVLDLRKAKLNNQYSKEDGEKL